MASLREIAPEDVLLNDPWDKPIEETRTAECVLCFRSFEKAVLDYDQACPFCRDVFGPEDFELEGEK